MKYTLKASQPLLFAFKLWHCGLSVQDQWTRNRRANYVIVLVWSVLIVGGWVVVYSRKCYLGSEVFLVFFKYGGRRKSPRLHLLVSDVYQGNGEVGCVQNFPAWPHSPYTFHKLLKIRECALKVVYGGVLGSWVGGICNHRLI